MKIKDKTRSSHTRRRKLFSLNTSSYQSFEHDDESRGDNEDLLQESQLPIELPPLYATKLSGPEHSELSSKEDETYVSTPDSFFDLIDGRNFDFASTPFKEDDPFAIETAPLVSGGSNTKETISGGLTRQAQKPKKRNSSLCEWPEDTMNEDLVEELWQESDGAQRYGGAHPLTSNSPPTKVSTPDCIVTGTIELKTADQPSGITFQKTNDICPLKIQGFSPFSHFKTKTNLEPGMVVLEINSREMTWESTKEAIAEIKKAKPGTITILAIAPSKIATAPKSLADKISNPPIAVNKKVKKSAAMTKIWPPKPAPKIAIAAESPMKKKSEEPKKPVTTESRPVVKQTNEGKYCSASVPMHYRDPSLMMMESTITEATEDETASNDVKVTLGPTFKQLNPSFMRVDSAVTTDTEFSASGPVPPTPRNSSSPKKASSSNCKTEDVPLDSECPVASPKSTPGSLLGQDEVEMDVVYIGESYSEEDEVFLPATFKMDDLLPSSSGGQEEAKASPTTPKQSNTAASTSSSGGQESKAGPATPKQSNTASTFSERTSTGGSRSINTSTNTNTKPPLPVRKKRTRETMKRSPKDPPAVTQKPAAEKESSSSTVPPPPLSSTTAEAPRSSNRKSSSQDEEEEASQEAGIFCNGLGDHVSPMLTTMKDVFNFANRCTKRMPSWVRVLCHE
ncbi:MAG: hypothetical protein SGBAC_005837 [Bacillariaceae sp.]